MWLFPDTHRGALAKSLVLIFIQSLSCPICIICLVYKTGLPLRSALFLSITIWNPHSSNIFAIPPACFLLNTKPRQSATFTVSREAAAMCTLRTRQIRAKRHVQDFERAQSQQKTPSTVTGRPGFIFHDSSAGSVAPCWHIQRLMSNLPEPQSRDAHIQHKHPVSRNQEKEACKTIKSDPNIKP